MILNLLLSLIPVCAATFLAAVTGGGTIYGILDWISFVGVLLLFAAGIFISGYGRTFCRIFSSKKKFQGLDLQELKKTDSALGFGEKILFYTTILVPILVLIYTLANYYKDTETYSHLGPNCSVLLLSILYLSLLEMIIITLKAKVRKSVILYMEEETDIQKEKSACNKKSILKMIAGIVLFISLFVLYGYATGIFAWGKKLSLISSVFDIPFIIIMCIYVLPLTAISGNFANLFKAIGITFSGRKINVSQKSLYLNAVKTTVKLNWYGAFSGAACGWIGMLNNLEDRSYLAPNLAVSLIPFFYAACVNLFLLLVEIRVTKAGE